MCTIGDPRPALPAHVRSVLPSKAYMSAPKSARSHEGGQPQQENTRRSGVNKCPMLYTHHPLPSSQAFPKADRLRQGKAELVSRASKAPSPWLNLGGTEPRESPGPASSQETSIVGRPRGPWRDPAARAPDLLHLRAEVRAWATGALGQRPASSRDLLLPPPGLIQHR